MWKCLPLALLALGVALTASCSSSPSSTGSSSGSGSGKPTSLPVEDDFSDCSKGWSTDVDEFVSLSCTDGTYRILVKNPEFPQHARILFDTGPKELTVEADAARRAGPEVMVYGVSCWASQDKGYLFVISPAGEWEIMKFTSRTSLPEALPLVGSPPTTIPEVRVTNRIRGVCAGGGQESTLLTLFVNGKKIGAVEDQAGLDSFRGFGLVVWSSEGGTDVRFDNLVAR